MPTTVTEQHLVMLDRLAQIGMIMAERLVALPPMPKQDTTRDLDIISRVVRRSILLYHLLENDQLPKPRPTPEPKSDAPAAPSAPSAPAGPDVRTRLDPVDRLDDVSGPFMQVVASIVTDIQTALGTCHYPADQEDLVHDIVHRQLPHPYRHEADTPDQN